MRRRVIAIIVALSLAAAACGAASAQPEELTGTLGGAAYVIRMPADWNGTLLVYAHGYGGIDDFGGTGSEVAAAPGGATIQERLLEDGYALAASAFSSNGWAVEEGISDTEALTRHFAEQVEPPERTILWGASMGSVIALALAEQSPLYDGVIALCAIGAGATRTFDASLAVALAYDAAFGWPAAWGLPGDVRDDLEFERDVLPVLIREATDEDSATRVRFMQAVGALPEQDPAIWFTAGMFFATAGKAELETRAGGPVSQNTGFVFTISPEDREELEGRGLDTAAMLDRMSGPVIEADPEARAYVARFANFTGDIPVPVLTLHTTVDGLVPVENQAVYAATVAAAGRSDHLLQLYTDTYPGSLASGHCTFTDDQVTAVVEGMSDWLETGTRPSSTRFTAAEGFVPGFEPGPWPLP